MNGSCRGTIRPALVVLLTALVFAPARADGQVGPAEVVSDDCTEMALFLGVPEDLVAPYVPDDYELTQSPLPSPLPRPQRFGAGRQEIDLLIRAFRCERQRVRDDVAEDRTLVQFGAVVKPQGRPVTGGVLDVYTFYWVSDNRRLVDWLREVRGARPALKYSRSMRLAATVPQGGGGLTPEPSWHSLEVTDPELSAFSLVFAAAERPIPVPLRVNWWLDVREGKLRLTHAIPVFLAGSPQAATARFTYQPDTHLAHMLRDGWGQMGFAFGRFPTQLTSREIAG